MQAIKSEKIADDRKSRARYNEFIHNTRRLYVIRRKYDSKGIPEA